MVNRILQVFISITLILSFASSGACVILSPHTGETACKKSKAIQDDINATRSKSCKPLPCNSNNTCVYTLPDSPFRRIETENRAFSKAHGSAAILDIPSALPNIPTGKAILNISLLFRSPPFFYLHCSLIC